MINIKILGCNPLPINARELKRVADLRHCKLIPGRPRRRAVTAPRPLGRQGGTMSHPLVHPRARRPLRAALVGTTAMALTVVLGPGITSAAAVQLGPLTKVSDGDPFAGCA